MMMKRKIIFGGVCTIGIAVAAMLSVVSCSGDDEIYEGGNYTLAKKRVTRGYPDGSDGFVIEGNDGATRKMSALFGAWLRCLVMSRKSGNL